METVDILHTRSILILDFSTVEFKTYVELINLLKDNFKIPYRYYDNFLKRVKVKYTSLFKEEGQRVLIPDGFLLKIIKLLKDKVDIRYRKDNDAPKPITADWDNLKGHNVSFRAYQKECLDAISEVVAAGLGGYVIAPPAFGKSHLISYLALLYPKTKIDVISKRRDVVAGIYSTLLKFTPKVGLVTTGSKTKDRVTIYTADSLKHSDFDAELIILDEIHELVTDNYYKTLSNYAGVRLGLTATPDTRFDNLHTRIEAICGFNIFQINYTQAEDNNIVVPILVDWVDVNGENPVEGISNPVERKRLGIWCNRYRNEIIAKTARKYADAGLQVLILTETIQHLANLKELLPDFEVCYSGTTSEGVYDGSLERMTPTKREELRRKFMNREIMKAIATGVWAVGVSFDDLQVLIRAEGSGSKTASVQVPGRACRIGKLVDKEYGIVVDFVDRFDKIFYKKAVERAKMYAKSGWVQISPDNKIVNPERVTL